MKFITIQHLLIVMAIACPLGIGCGGSASEGQANHTGAGTDASGAKMRATPQNDAAGSQSDGQSNSSTNAAGDSTTAESLPNKATGGSGSEVDIQAAPIPTQEATPPCDPTTGGRVSEPGRYEGYSEVLYDGHEQTSFYVTVRDGTQLAMDLYRPTRGGKVVEEPLPVLWMHTPYNRRTFTGGLTARTYPGFALRLVEYGYVVATVDYRGLYASFGRNTGFNRGEWVDAARMDAYDVTEWLAEQAWSSGKIGMWGCSATGGSQLQAATTAPPHLRAVFPMSCEFDAYPFGVPGGMSRSAGNTKEPPAATSGALRDATAAAVDGADGTRLMREAIDEHADNIENPGYVPFRDSTATNIPEVWWSKSSPHTYIDELNTSGIAVYVAANWDEGATKYGAFFTYNNLETPTKLLVGPSGHCEWSNVLKDADFDLVVEELRFFDYWLKDVENCVMSEPGVYYYTYNAAQGKAWQASTSWPLESEQRVNYYLGDKSLQGSAPTDASATDTFEVDYSNREAGIVYETAALSSAVQVTGHPEVALWVASSAADGDFIVTLEDVDANGRATTYNMHGRLRASQRALEDAPYNNLGLPWHPHTEASQQELTPGEPTLLQFDMLPISIVFAEGHRIRVKLTFADDTTPTLQPAPTVTVFRDAAHPSAIILPVIP